MKSVRMKILAYAVLISIRDMQEKHKREVLALEVSEDE